jgi:hypothetical protein
MGRSQAVCAYDCAFEWIVCLSGCYEGRCHYGVERESGCGREGAGSGDVRGGGYISGQDHTGGRGVFYHTAWQQLLYYLTELPRGNRVWLGTWHSAPHLV